MNYNHFCNILSLLYKSWVYPGGIEHTVIASIDEVDFQVVLGDVKMYVGTLSCWLCPSKSLVHGTRYKKCSKIRMERGANALAVGTKIR